MDNLDIQKDQLVAKVAIPLAPRYSLALLVVQQVMVF
jgi:hypothetical protein